MKKIQWIGVLILLVILSACGGGQPSSSETQGSNNDNNNESNDENYTFRLAFSFPNTGGLKDNFDFYVKELEKRSDGRIKVEVFPGGQLMPGNQEIPALLDGQIDMNYSHPSILSTIEPSYRIFDLPFLFDHDPEDLSVYLNHLSAFLNGGGGDIINSKMEDHGLIVIANITGSDPGILLTGDSDLLITDVASMNGLKVRVAGGQILPEVMEAVGASGVSIATAELASAITQGVIDGVVTQANYAIEANMPVKTATFVPITASVTPILMAVDKFNSLPQDIQDIILEVGLDLQEFSNESMMGRYAPIFDDLTELGIEYYLPTEQEIEEWKNAVLPVWDQVGGWLEGAEDLIDAAVETSAAN